MIVWNHRIANGVTGAGMLAMVALLLTMWPNVAAPATAQQHASFDHAAHGWNSAHAALAGAVQTSDVAIETLEDGFIVTDACYVLVDFSNEGCDRNKDGAVTFRDVPLGTYTLHQTADLGPGRVVEDTTITVTGSLTPGWEYFQVVVDIPVSSLPAGLVDISLITRDPDTGELLTGTCYVLVDYSNEGCDENGDGQVTFADIPSFATYAVRQTRVPAGYAQIDDYQIDVVPTDYPTGFVVRQAPQQNAPDTRHVSVMLIDVATNTKVPLDACVRIGDVSNIGCDRDLIDGQIDFLDVQAGTHDIVVTSLPAGYAVTNPYDLVVTIDPQNDPVNVFVYVHVIRQP